MNSTTELSAHDRILSERSQYVSAGVSVPKLVVSHADGARVTDVNGRTFIDFAGGIGCQNTGHRFAPVVDEFYGERGCRLRDPFGHHWLIGHSIEKVTPEEMQRRYTAMCAGT